jgi:hypothetical protein
MSAHKINFNNRRTEPVAEEVMKAAIALVILYVGTFFMVVRGASQNPVEASQDATPGAAAQRPINQEKLADIRSLLELMGVRDIVADAENKGLEQFRTNLTATAPNNQRGQEFVGAFVTAYQQKFNPDDVSDEVAAVYDRHFTGQEIKGLLQFYGSPLGQKYAAEMPRVSFETQAATRQLSGRVAREVLKELRKQYPGVAAQARLTKPREEPAAAQNPSAASAGNSEAAQP